LEGILKLHECRLILSHLRGPSAQCYYPAKSNGIEYKASMRNYKGILKNVSTTLFSQIITFELILIKLGANYIMIVSINGRIVIFISSTY
jgi:hypothetical protein